MSAVRRHDRRTTRNKLASPYARPTKSDSEDKKKKPLWSFSGLLSFLNPFGKSTDRDDSHSPATTTDILQRSPPPQMHRAQQVQLDPGADMEWNLPPILPQAQAPPPPPPLSSPPIEPHIENTQTANSQQAPQTPPRNSLPFPLTSPSHFSSSSSAYNGTLAKNLEPVTRFLVEKAGQPLNEFEAAGIVDYIQRNVQGADKPEPFRFSTSPSRGTSPSFTIGSSSKDTPSSAPSPRKTLTKNPNGVYRWQGAGSSRPRNRYQSPGFGSRPQQSRIKLSPPKTPLTTDTKRRRVGDEAESTAAQRAPMPSTSGSTSSVDFPSASSEPTSQSSHPSISTSMATPNGKARASLAPPSPVTPKTNGVQGSRIRTTGLSNTPAVPSPLRQAWKSSDSPPQHSQSSRPTRAADFMTELLKEVTPAKKPDVSNPYQTASPVKPPPRKPISKRPRPAPKSAEKPEEKEPELTAQEIIEATVPKGSKRSRPPPGLEKAPRVEEVSDEEPCTPVNGTLSHSSRLSSSTPSTAEVEEIVVVDKEESPLKKRKTAESPHPSKPSATVEIVDIDAPESTLAPPVIRPSEVIEADEAPKVNGKPSSPAARLSPPAHNPKSAFGVKSSAPKEPSKLRYSYQADKVEVVGSHPAPPLPTSFTPPPAPPAAKLKLSPKEEVLAMDIDELPKYMFTVKETVYPAGPSSESARGAALDVPESSLPTFDIRVIPFKAMDGFNWTAAGMKPPTGATGWKCDLCGLDNAESAKYKCTVCDASRPGAAVPPKPAEVTPPAPPAAPVKAFDWSAAGMAPPPKPGGGGSWTCSLCGLSNPATATDKCPVCDNPR